MYSRRAENHVVVVFLLCRCNAIADPLLVLCTCEGGRNTVTQRMCRAHLPHSILAEPHSSAQVAVLSPPEDFAISHETAYIFFPCYQINL